jgi:membrane fusion protein (multidrug efflux system)
MDRWAAAIGIVVVAVIAWFLLRPSGSEGPKGPAAGPGAPGMAAPPVVSAIAAGASPFTETMRLTGTIVANESVDVVSEIAGRVVKIGFAEGGRVTKGQLLVKLWDADLQARLAKAERQLRLDEDRLRRVAALKPVDGVSAQDLDVATATAEMRRAEIDELKAQISRTELRAPFSGRVGIRTVSEGAVIAPQTRITTLQDDAGVKVDLSVPERVATIVRPGTTLQVALRGMEGTRRATITAVDPGLRSDTRTLRVRARLADAAGVVPGMFADVELTLDAVANAIMIPSEAVVQDINGASVFLVQDGKAIKTPVELGGRTDTHVRVMHGVKPGDTVITTGLLFVKKNMPVKVRP